MNELETYAKDYRSGFEVFSVNGSLIIERSVQLESQSDLLPAKAMVARAGQFVENVSDINLFQLEPKVKVADIESKRSLRKSTRQGLANRLRELAEFDKDYLSDELILPTDDVVMDFDDRYGGLLAVIKLLFDPSSERVETEHSILHEVLDYSDFSHIGKVETELSMRLGAVHFSSLPSEANIRDYLDLVFEESPDKVVLDPYI